MADSVLLENMANNQVMETRIETTITEEKKKKTSKKSKRSKSDASALKSKSQKIHVRSVDAAQVQKKFNKAAPEADVAASQLCKLCNRQVFQMERIKAEKSVWHKNCFACRECNKKLTVDTYNSHEGVLYCKPHFKQLFQPKAVLEDDSYYTKPEIIIRENEPTELPTDVVRATETYNYGIEELNNLDLKSRFTVFEHANKTSNENMDNREETRTLKRSDSLMSRLRRFDRENASLKNPLAGSEQQLDIVDSSSENDDTYDLELVGNRRSLRGLDHSVSFGSISDIKSKWEEEPQSRREELARQRKEELKIIRARQCQGRQNRLKEAYEQAIQETHEKEGHEFKDATYDPEKVRQLKNVFEKGEIEETPANRPETHVNPEKLNKIKEIFESKQGEDVHAVQQDRNEELSVVARANKDARNVFKKLEQNGFQEKQPERSKQLYGLENKEAFKRTSTMLDLFRRLEREPEQYGNDDDEEEGSEEEGSDYEESGSEHAAEDDEEDRENNFRRASQQEDFMQIMKDRALGKSLREKFERWEFASEEEKQMCEKSFMTPEQEELQASLKTAKNLRAHFENLQKEPPKQPEKPKFKVNRFV